MICYACVGKEELMSLNKPTAEIIEINVAFLCPECGATQSTTVKNPEEFVRCLRCAASLRILIFEAWTEKEKA
jgi:transcription elongation factor Elf1